MRLTHVLQLIVLTTSLILLSACRNSPHKQLVLVGTYTGTGSEGIYAYEFDTEKGALNPLGLSVNTENPSFLTIDPKGRYVYAVNELDSFQQQASGAISVFSLNQTSGKLKFMQQIPSLGAAPCHLSMDMTRQYLLVANYNGGNAIVFPIAHDGTLGPHTAFVQNSGSSVNVNRQSGPHAHYIQVTKDNRFAMIADLGTDQVLVHSFDSNTGSLSPVDSGHVKAEAGAGPRHLAYDPTGKFVFVLNELTATISVFSLDPETGKLKPNQTIATLPADFSGANTAAEIIVHPSGNFLYVSNRGADSISIFSIGTDGTLASFGWISSGGKSPRHFEIDPTGQWLIAANQHSDNLVVFSIDHSTGSLTQNAKYEGISSPVCVVFASTLERQH